MTTSEIIKQEGIMLIRNRKEEHEKGAPWTYDVKEAFTGKKKGWVYLDQFTKSAMVAVYNALNEEMQAKFDRIHINRLIDFTWANVK